MSASDHLQSTARKGPTTPPISPIRVLYIAGHVRSGSTVLSTMLGNHPEMAAVGELEVLPSGAWLEGAYCACGEPGPQCPFWSEVLARWSPDRQADDIAEYIGLQGRFTRYRSLPFRLPRMRRHPSPEFRRFAERTGALFRAIGEASGKAVIVDASKNPARALALSIMPGIDLRLVHLIRDGRGVVWSRKKAFTRDSQAGVQLDIEPHSSARTALRWSLSNSCAELARRRLGDRAIQVRYEDLARDPGVQLARIGSLMSIDPAPLTEMVEGGRQFAVGHVIAGNRLRMAGTITVQSDTEWEEALPALDRAVFWTLAGWLARRYGYRRA